MNGTWLDIVSESEAFRLREARRLTARGACVARIVTEQPATAAPLRMRSDVARLASILASLDPRAHTLRSAPTG